jgi:integrase
MAEARFTERTLKALNPGETAWDTEVHGLGARLRTAGGDTWFVFKYRSPVERDATGRGRQRFLTIGRWGRGDYGIDDARRAATAHRDALRQGRDPATERDALRKALTVAQVCDAYLDALPTLLLRRQRRPKKDSTVASDRGRIERHIKPLLGTLPIGAVTRKHVVAFMHDVAAGKTAKREKLDKKRALSNVRGGKGVATRTVGLLGGIFTWAVAEGLRPDNPVHGVTRFADQKRERRLSDDEYRQLGEGLAQAATDGVNPHGIAATRLLALTGWRMGDATTLRHDYVDAARRTARLPETKTDASIRPLSQAALALIEGHPRTTSPFVFPARQAGPVAGATARMKPLQGLPRMWDTIRSKAGLPDDVTLHVLRHSFASLAADLGYSDAVIAALIGHRRTGMTARYTHAAEAVVLRAADEVARVTLALMAGRGREDHPPIEAAEPARALPKTTIAAVG